jgi:hypothetical protein
MVKRNFEPPHYVKIVLFLLITFILMTVTIKREREFFNKKEDHFSRIGPEIQYDGSDQEMIEKSLVRLREIWEKGLLAFPKDARKLDNSCQEYYVDSSVGTDYHKCNPQFLQCVFTGKFPNLTRYLKIKLKGQEADLALLANFESNPNYSQEKRVYEIYKARGQEKFWGPDFGWRVELSVKNISIPLILEDSCSTTYLPQKVYSYGPALEDAQQMEWDNVGRDYYLDKYLVTKRDVAEWKYAGEQAWDYDPKDAFKPSTELNLREREEFCAFRKKSLMKAEIFDAASLFLYKAGDQLLKGWFPWSRGKNDKFLKPLSEQQVSLSELELKKLCQLVSTSECKKSYPYKFRSQMTPSWMGVFDVLGGYAETFSNTINPNLNLKLSSMAFNRFSRNHILGVRETWDGVYPAGFRCYREEFGE